MKKTKSSHQSYCTGMISVTALVFMCIFVFILVGLANLSLLQKRVQVSKEEGTKALAMAEAGLEYYRWRLGHFPNDVQDGTGVAGPYVHDFYDPEGSATGKYSLAISGNYQCGVLTSVDVVSTAWTLAHPEIRKTITGRYMRPSVANYSYILDSNVLVGDDRIIYGPYHSNGGIDFRGTNYSSVTSKQTTWNCTSSFCSPTQSDAPGVTHDSGGTGSGDTLWKSPVPQIDFTIIAQNLSDIYRKNVASTTPGVCNAGQSLGCYFPRTNPGSTMNKGYQVIFNADGTFTLYKVTATESITGTPVSYGTSSCSSGVTVTEESVIANSGSNGVCPYAPNSGARTLVGTFAPPTSCKLLYFDDNVWMEGMVNGKITVIAASSTSSDNPNIYLRNSINYNPADGTKDGLTALAENSVKIPVDSPNNLTVNGIFIAQLGYFGRDYYNCSLPEKYDNCKFQNQMNIYGTVVSKGRVGTKWGESNGYNLRIDDYDSSLFNDPPPLTPYTEDTYKFVQWTQDQ